MKRQAVLVGEDRQLLLARPTRSLELVEVDPTPGASTGIARAVPDHDVRLATREGAIGNDPHEAICVDRKINRRAFSSGT